MTTTHNFPITLIDMVPFSLFIDELEMSLTPEQEEALRGLDELETEVDNLDKYFVPIPERS